jgi:hypothetical protein
MYLIGLFADYSQDLNCKSTGKVIQCIDSIHHFYLCL